MKRDHLINMVWMQTLWFVSVVGAAYSLTWPAFLWFVFFATWQLQITHRQKTDIQLMLVSILIGVILDSAWIKLGWIQFSNPGPLSFIAPPWIIILWSGLGLTINHSLAWLQNRLFFAGFIAGIISPFSYLAAQRLGALQILLDSWTWVFGLALGWALAIPLLLWLANQLTQVIEETYDA